MRMVIIWVYIFQKLIYLSLNLSFEPSNDNIDFECLNLKGNIEFRDRNNKIGQDLINTAVAHKVIKDSLDKNWYDYYTALFDEEEPDSVFEENLKLFHKKLNIAVSPDRIKKIDTIQGDIYTKYKSGLIISNSIKYFSMLRSPLCSRSVIYKGFTIFNESFGGRMLDGAASMNKKQRKEYFKAIESHQQLLSTNVYYHPDHKKSLVVTYFNPESYGVIVKYSLIYNFRIDKVLDSLKINNREYLNLTEQDYEARIVSI